MLRGVRDGRFMPTAALDVPGSSYVRSVAVGDFNADGREDVAAAGYSSVSVRLGNGNGTFSGGVDLPFDPVPASVAAGDFDGNGTEDLAVLADAAPARVAILPGKGDGTFAPMKTVSLPITVGGK